MAVMFSTPLRGDFCVQLEGSKCINNPRKPFSLLPLMAVTVEITTTQNVTIEYDLARLRERVLAYLLDGMVMILAYGLLVVLLLAAFGRFLDSTKWVIFFYVLFFVLWLGYHIFSETMMNGQTVGKKASGIKVMRLDGKELRWSDVTLRAVLQIVDVITCMGIVGVILVKTTPKGQRLGDLAANTTVVKLQMMSGKFSLNDILNIASIENYTPRFPQIKQLPEQDILLIKRTLSRYQSWPNEAHAEAVDQLAERLKEVLHIEQPIASELEFLRTLLRDYIVLTR